MKNADYCCIINEISTSEVIKLLENIDLLRVDTIAVHILLCIFS